MKSFASWLAMSAAPLVPTVAGSLFLAWPRSLPFSIEHPAAVIASRVNDRTPILFIAGLPAASGIEPATAKVCKNDDVNRSFAVSCRFSGGNPDEDEGKSGRGGLARGDSGPHARADPGGRSRDERGAQMGQ